MENDHAYETQCLCPRCQQFTSDLQVLAKDNVIYIDFKAKKKVG